MPNDNVTYTPFNATKIAADTSALLADLSDNTVAPSATGLKPSLDVRIAVIEEALKRHGIA